jgi:Zn-dependent metalloprotease
MRISSIACLLCAGLSLAAQTAPTRRPVSPKAVAPDPNVGAVALKILRAWQPALGLDQHNTFAVNTITPDKLLGTMDVRIDQYYLGVRVLGGEAILHLKGDHPRSFSDSLKRKFHFDAHPSLTASEALAVAVRDLHPRGPFVLPPSTELVAARMKLGPGTPTLQDALCYQIHLELENGSHETSHTNYLINAHTGAICKKWNSLQTGAALGSGQSQYSGKVAISTNDTGNGFELRDLTRGDSGNTVLDLGHGTGDSGGSIFTSASNTWGDGQNYAGGATNSSNGQTAAVDAAYGSQWTWDYYKNIHGRNGIDGNGTATSMRVHYSSAYDNAFWSDSCFCMTFGDGSRFKSLEAIDVMGHEMSHGVCANTAALQYYGESGGLNEANSDINGTMVEFYARGGGGARIGEKGGNWTMGEQLATAGFPRPLRWMYKPSKDGASPDAWYDGIDSLDPHNSSGPMNRCFYFLSQGASADPKSDYSSKYLTQGMTGLGNDRAARIWYRALATYLTSSAGYADARTASIAAAKDLHGAGSQEEQAVWNAFHAINVGKPWPASSNTVTATITAPATGVKVASGVPLAFQGTATDSSPTATLTTTWDFGDGATATGTAASHVFSNDGSADTPVTVSFRVADNAGASASDTLLVTVTPAAPIPASELILNGDFETGGNHWQGNTERIGHWPAHLPSSGSRSAWLLGSPQTAQQVLYQFVVLPAKTASATLAFQLKVEDPGQATTPVATLTVEVLDAAGSTTLATYSNLDAGPGYVRHTLPVPVGKAEMIALLFRANAADGAGTSFSLDEISLQAR